MEPIISRATRLMLVLYYREGWSYRRIGRAFKLDHKQVIRAMSRALDRICDSLPDAPCPTHPLIEGLFSPPDDAERQAPAIVALRQEQLAQRLDTLMDERAYQLEAMSECMGANCPLPHSRNKGHAWTCWEIRYLNATGRTTIPNSAYRADKAAKYSDDHAPGRER